MSITDELREWASRELSYKTRFDELLAIADRIDAEYEKAIQQVLMGEGGVPATDENMAEHGWVRLPKDADGECIHLGDVMEWVSDDECYSPVIRTVEAVGEGTFFAWDGINGRHAQYEAHAYRHHEPTVEDVLREFGDWYAHVKGGCDEDGIIAVYAQRLQLREVDE